MQNINKNNDVYYRYKMPIPCIKNVKNTTIIENLKDIANSLKCPAEYIIIFLKTELGTNTVISSDKAIINGHHSKDIINLNLEKFINMFILCPKCSLPECDFNGKKLNCRACGCISSLKNHKLTSFILKNNKKKKTPIKKAEKNNKDNEEIIWFSDISKEAMEKRREEAFN
jgi:translation initiation factor 5